MLNSIKYVLFLLLLFYRNNGKTLPTNMFEEDNMNTSGHSYVEQMSVNIIL